VTGAVLCACGCGRSAPLATRTRAERSQVRGEPVRFIRGHAMAGRTASTLTRQKMSRAHVAYSTIHRWIARVAIKTGVCSQCGQRRFTNWANLSGAYRRDVEDFAEMCVPCHRRYDRARKVVA